MLSRTIIVTALLLSGCATAKAQKTSAPRKAVQTDKTTKTQTVTIIDQRPQVRSMFGSLRLGMSLAQMSDLLKHHGWKGVISADCEAILTPPSTDVAREYRVKVAGGRLVMMAMKLRTADPKLTETRLSYKRSVVRADGSWAMTDESRRTLVVITAEGDAVLAIALHLLNPEVAQRIFRKQFGER